MSIPSSLAGQEFLPPFLFPKLKGMSIRAVRALLPLRPSSVDERDFAAADAPPMDAITISAAFQFVWEGTSRKDVHLGGSPAKANKSITVWKGEGGLKSVQKRTSQMGAPFGGCSIARPKNSLAVQ